MPHGYTLLLIPGAGSDVVCTKRLTNPTVLVLLSCSKSVCKNKNEPILKRNNRKRGLDDFYDRLGYYGIKHFAWAFVKSISN
jgi:hypothetical protein